MTSDIGSQSPGCITSFLIPCVALFTAHGVIAVTLILGDEWRAAACVVQRKTLHVVTNFVRSESGEPLITVTIHRGGAAIGVEIGRRVSIFLGAVVRETDDLLDTEVYKIHVE